MDVKEIRRLNLEALISGAQTIEGLVRGTELIANYLSQIRSGHRGMGNEMARKIEAAKGLPHGWMDTMRFEDPDRAMEAIELVQIMSSLADEDKQAATGTLVAAIAWLQFTVAVAGLGIMASINQATRPHAAPEERPGNAMPRPRNAMPPAKP